MKLTKESKNLISFFAKHNCLTPIKQTNKTRVILQHFYNDIKSGVSYIEQLKLQKGENFYKMSTKNITNIRQIPKPSTFSPNAFPEEIRKHIDKTSLISWTYDFHLFNKSIQIIFVKENETGGGMYNKYVDYMLVWLYIINKYAPSNCAKKLKVFVYHTSLTKVLPNSNADVLNENNVNTAFTRTCPVDSEIVVFRKEEWFKVFMHETFHNFGLDFSGINLSESTNKILSLFPVKSEVNLFESYTEFWARIMNALFCSFVSLSDKEDVQSFLKNAELFINLERIYTFFQMVKVLDFMGLKYVDLYNKTNASSVLRETMYKEDTNVLSYYVLVAILMNNFQEFLGWSHTNNISILRFKKTPHNLREYCRFIEKKYKATNMLESVECAETMLYTIKRRKNARILTSLRMTMCELG